MLFTFSQRFLYLCQQTKPKETILNTLFQEREQLLSLFTDRLLWLPRQPHAYAHFADRTAKIADKWLSSWSCTVFFNTKY